MLLYFTDEMVTRENIEVVVQPMLSDAQTGLCVSALLPLECHLALKPITEE